VRHQTGSAVDTIVELHAVVVSKSAAR